MLAEAVLERNDPEWSEYRWFRIPGYDAAGMTDLLKFEIKAWAEPHIKAWESPSGAFVNVGISSASHREIKSVCLTLDQVIELRDKLDSIIADRTEVEKAPESEVATPGSIAS